MFRPMRRASRAIPEEAAKHLLQQSRRGVLAVNGDDGYPFAIPVNYYYDQEHDKIYFHGAKSGQKVDALKQNDKVCFTVYGNEHFEPGDWAPYVQSTVVFGRCHLIDDAAATEARVRELANIVKTTVFLADMSLFAEMNAVYAKYFEGDFPARSAVAVKALPKGALVEIESIAVR